MLTAEMFVQNFCAHLAESLRHAKHSEAMAV